MDSLSGHPSSQPFNLLPTSLSLSSADHQLLHAHTASSYDPAYSLVNYPLSPPYAMSSYGLDHCHDRLAASSDPPKVGWARILDEMSRGVHPMNILEDSAHHRRGINTGNIFNDTNYAFCDEKTHVCAHPLRNALSLSALDWEEYGINHFDDDDDDEQAHAKRSRRLGSLDEGSDYHMCMVSKGTSKDLEAQQGASQGYKWPSSQQKQSQTKPGYSILESFLHDSEDELVCESSSCFNIEALKPWAGPALITKDNEPSEKASWTECSTLENFFHDDVNAPNSKGPSCFLTKAKAWAGPTLKDIEAALAHDTMSKPSPSNWAFDVNSSPTYATLSSESSSVHPFFSSSLPHVPAGKVHHWLHRHKAIRTQLSLDIASSLQISRLERLAHSTETFSKQATIDDSWRLRLQKRNNGGPKETRKTKSEEEAMSDGYRWRKYGQKAIKNSSFRRSYYKCSSENCNARKQVERVEKENEAFFLATYEGLHLHHKPNYVRKAKMKLQNGGKKKQKSLDKCSPTSSTNDSSHVDLTRFEPLSSNLVATSSSSTSPTFNTLLSLEDLFSPTTTLQNSPLHMDIGFSLDLLFE